MTKLLSNLYSPLKAGSTRLLRINSKTSEASIGALVEVSLEVAPPYYALSHCWGHQDTGREIQIGHYTITVDSELAICVQRLRELASQDSLAEPARYVWIDSICIDQSNDIERSSQVQQMGRIYSQSIRTLIWLGPGTAAYSGAWSLVDHIYNISTQKPSSEDKPVAKMYSATVHISSGLPIWNSKLWAQLKATLELRWFSRIWIFQETVLSQQDPIILLEDQTYPWHRLGEAALWLRKNGYLRLTQLPAELLNVNLICDIRNTIHKLPLDVLLSLTQIKFHATDQRDKLYSLFGVYQRQLGCEVPDELRPNYLDSVEDVYIKASRFLITESRSLGLLSRTHGTGKSLSKRQRHYELKCLPSWVPDWSDFDFFNKDLRTSFSWVYYGGTESKPRLGFPSHFAASAGLEAKIHPSSDSSRLRISGINVSRLSYVCAFNPENTKRMEFQALFTRSLVHICSNTISILAREGISLWISHLIRTSCAEQYQFLGYNWEQCLRDGAACLLDVLHNNADLASQVACLDDWDAFSYLQSISEGGASEHFVTLATNYCFNRSFFMTSCGRMGIGPSDASENDHCSVLLGGGVAYVIRQKSSDWVFVGEAYVSGLMSGEAVQACKDGLLHEEVFEFV
jgi:hypothetical protein